MTRHPDYRPQTHPGEFERTPITVLERLLAEELPTGTFGGSTYTPKQPAMPRQPDPDAARHRADLESALARPPRSALHRTHLDTKRTTSDDQPS
jgi:hypothetical protein